MLSRREQPVNRRKLTDKGIKALKKAPEGKLSDWLEGQADSGRNT